MKGLKTLAIALICLPVAMTASADTPADKVVFADFKVDAPLTGEAASADRGREIFANRKQGNCLACHTNTDFDGEELFHGEIGPGLDGAGSRWSEGELRAIVVNSKEVFGDQTIMPAFYRTSGLNRTLDKFEGKTILSAQQVEDLVAYLQTLTE